MLTINVMVRFGPWTLCIEDLLGRTNWQQCERCSTTIRYVHVCQVEGETKEWRIGSECGPSLIEASAAVWEKAADGALRDMVLLHRAMRLKPLESRTTSGVEKSYGPNWVDRAVEVLIAGKTHERTLSRNKFGRPTDLEVIQSRLRLAEKFHNLKRITMGIEE